MQNPPNFQQLLNQFTADLENNQAKVKAGSTDPHWDLYYADVSVEAAAAKACFDSRMAVQGVLCPDHNGAD